MKITRLIDRVSPNFVTLYKVPFLKKSLRQKIENRDCFVLGSGPSPDLSLYSADKLIICVNGSAANAKQLGLPSPAMTVIDNELLCPETNKNKYSRSVIIQNDLLADLRLGLLVATQSNSNRGGDPKCLNANFENYVRINKRACRYIAESVTCCSLLESNVHGLLSRGGMAIALCAWAGARSIVFSGFSLFKGKSTVTPHFYPSILNKTKNDIEIDWLAGANCSSEWNVRSHSMADSALIALLRIGGFDIRCSHKDFAPVLCNWGIDPPDWAK